MAPSPLADAWALTLRGLLACVLAAASTAQEPWELGPCSVGRRLDTFEHPDSSSVTGNVYGSIWYPAHREGRDAPPHLAGGPYPHVVFFHGHTALSGSYSALIRQLVSWGFVVSAVETNSGIRGEHSMHGAFARDQELFIDYIEAQARRPGSFYHGLIDGGDLGVFGHSLGASALFFYLPREPRVRAALSLQPYVGPKYGGVAGGFAGAAEYAERLVVLSGTEDEVTHPETQNRLWFEGTPCASWRLWTIVDGMGHLGPLDSPPAPQKGSLPMDEQLRVHRLYATALFRATLRGEEELLERLTAPADVGAGFEHHAAERGPELCFLLIEGGARPLALPVRPGAGPAAPLPPGVRPHLARLHLNAHGRARRVQHPAGSLSWEPAETTIPAPSGAHPRRP